MPVSLLDPIWAQFAVLLPDYPPVVPTHPLGRHRRRIADRIVFEHVVAALVHGSGYERIASPGCSDRTIRRRVHAWAEAGLAERLHQLVLAQFDRMIGLELEDLAVDGCITKAPGGGEAAGRSPVDRGKQGLKRSTVTDATGIPLHLVATGANRPDAELLAATLTGALSWLDDPAQTTVHLDAGYAQQPVRRHLAELRVGSVIAPKGERGPVQASARWVVERTHGWMNGWMNGFGKLRRCTERCRVVVEFSLFLAATFVVVRQLIERARNHYRWAGRPTSRRLR